MLNEEQISSVAASLNEKINIPMMSEEKEQSMLEKAVGMINGQLSVVTASLPESAQDILSRLGDGISEEEAAELKEALVPALNEKVDIPFLNEDQEADMLIAPVVDMIISTVGKVTG
mgnify:CR=1 FL=1